MNPKDKRWTDDEIKWLSENYSKIGRKECSRILNRTKLAISTKTSELGIKFYKQPRLNHKFCSNCKMEKPFESFSKNKKRRFGLHHDCKDCHKIKMRIYESSKEVRTRKKIRNRKNYFANIERKKKYGKLWRIKNREKIRLRNEQRRKNDVNLRIKQSLSARLRSALKEAGVKKSNKTLDFVGCSIEFFRNHIESQFEPEMNWDNYGELGWVLDHVVACEWFNLVNPEEQKLCFNFKNIMPRWATTDIAKAHGSNQIGNSNKQEFIVDNSYYHLLQNPS